jgi:colanic acid biosynthesis glycosyl transferase WcaI
VRILVLNQYFYPDASATSQLLTELCEDLAERHDVFVVTGRPSYNVAAQTRSRGLVSRELFGKVRVARVWSTSFDRTSMSKRLANYATYLGSSVVGAMAVPKPDIVVALTDPPPIGLVGAMTARIRRVPFVLVTKDIFPDVAIELGVLRSPNVIKLLRAIKHLLFSAADRVVSIGRDMDARLLDLGVTPGKIVTIRDWADGDAIHPLTSPSTMRMQRGWADRFVVMHSGNVGLSQDLTMTIDAAERLRHEPNILFAIVGEGASKSALQAETRRRGLENVEFLPFQDKAVLADSLGAADVHLVTLRDRLAGYIVPSKLYGILAAGKPVIAACGEGSEPDLIVREYDCGYSLHPGDSEALAATILRAREDDLEAKARRARKAFEARFERRAATDAYRRLLEEVAN